MKRTSTQLTWEQQRDQIAKQLFSEDDPDDPNIRKAMDYLEDCVTANRILSNEFYSIFKFIPRQLIDQAVGREKKSILEVIVRCAEVQSAEAHRRVFYDDVKNIPRIRASEGQRHHRGAHPS